jgi:hypothetical protein
MASKMAWKRRDGTAYDLLGIDSKSTKRKRAGMDPALFQVADLACLLESKLQSELDGAIAAGTKDGIESGAVRRSATAAERTGL